MRIKDIKRQTTWVKQVQVNVKEVTQPMDAPEGGLVQSIDVTFDQGVDDTMRYYFTDTQFALGLTETGPQWFDIKWTGSYLKCKPAKAKEQVTMDDDYPDWGKIALGKCRHKHVDKLLERMLPSELLSKQNELKAINKLVEFEAKGIIE